MFHSNDVLFHSCCYQFYMIKQTEGRKGTEGRKLLKVCRITEGRKCSILPSVVFYLLSFSTFSHSTFGSMGNLRSFFTFSHSTFGHFLLSVILHSVILRSVFLSSVILCSIILQYCTFGHSLMKACQSIGRYLA